jgi:hypothetical protein
MPPPATCLCPHCRQPLALPDPLPAGFLTCPSCGGSIVLDQAPSPADAAPPDPAADELDANRIQQLSRARRATIRSRSYLIIGAVLCGIATLQLCYLARRDGWATPRAAAYVVLAIGAGFGCIDLLRKARRLGKELKRPILPETQSPPDFSTLQDGSQRVDRLNQMR